MFLSNQYNWWNNGISFLYRGSNFWLVLFDINFTRRLNMKTLWRTGSWVAGLIAGEINDWSDTKHAIVTIIVVAITTAICNYCCDKYADLR